ncbi:MAG: hypothetical protein IH624_02575 [Phycisphaerae bacterium]|nr:hypothetical protein [Phycisphaerae bacterium]
MAQILVLLQEQVGSSTWDGNVALQTAFCKALEQAALKSQGVQRDPNSGGPRTYLSQLKCLGLLFEDPHHVLYYTKAGADLISGCPPLPILQTLLLRHQYPSIYALGKNVKIDPRLHVKPFLFVLQLLRDPRIQYLTVDELKIPIVYGHNHDCLELCIAKILQLRAGRNIASLIDDPLDLYTRRRPTPNIRQDTSNSGDIYYVANTCKNYMQAACLVAVETVGSEVHILPSPTTDALVTAALNNVHSFIKLPSMDQEQREEIFQRQLGSWDRTKDTRRLVKPAGQVTAGESIIRSHLYQLLGTTILSGYPDAFVDKMVSAFGFDETMVVATIEPFLPKSLDIFESTYLAYSIGGTPTAIDFERATCELFDKKLRFASEHTGQRARPSGVGGYADVFAVALDNRHCALIDTKASRSYSISSSDYAKMTSNYIPNYRELCGSHPFTLEFVSYVAGGFANIASKLKEIHKETRVPASAITAQDLLRLSGNLAVTHTNQSQLRTFFSQSKQLYSKNCSFSK